MPCSIIFLILFRPAVATVVIHTVIVLVVLCAIAAFILLCTTLLLFCALLLLLLCFMCWCIILFLERCSLVVPCAAIPLIANIDIPALLGIVAIILILPTIFVIFCLPQLSLLLCCVSWYFSEFSSPHCCLCAPFSFSSTLLIRINFSKLCTDSETEKQGLRK